MRMNLRRIREFQHLTINELANRCNIIRDRLRDIENYRVLPDFRELCRILKATGHYFDETFAIIWHDIEDHYQPYSLHDYREILASIRYSESATTEDIEKRFPDE